jgi:hypothetical protein
MGPKEIIFRDRLFSDVMAELNRKKLNKACKCGLTIALKEIKKVWTDKCTIGSVLQSWGTVIEPHLRNTWRVGQVTIVYIRQHLLNEQSAARNADVRISEKGRFITPHQPNLPLESTDPKEIELNEIINKADPLFPFKEGAKPTQEQGFQALMDQDPQSNTSKHFKGEDHRLPRCSLTEVKKEVHRISVDAACELLICQQDDGTVIKITRVDTSMVLQAMIPYPEKK